MGRGGGQHPYPKTKPHLLQQYWWQQCMIRLGTGAQTQNPETPLLSFCSPQSLLPSVITSFTCPVPHERHAGPFLGTHRSCKWGPCCPNPLSAGRRHARTHQPRIRLLLLGQSQGPRCSPWLQRVTSVCVREDERRCEHKSAECDQRGPRCTLRTTLCCLYRRGSHAAL